MKLVDITGINGFIFRKKIIYANVGVDNDMLEYENIFAIEGYVIRFIELRFN